MDSPRNSGGTAIRTVPSAQRGTLGAGRRAQCTATRCSTDDTRSTTQRGSVSRIRKRRIKHRVRVLPALSVHCPLQRFPICQGSGSGAHTVLVGPHIRTIERIELQHSPPRPLRPCALVSPFAHRLRRRCITVRACTATPGLITESRREQSREQQRMQPSGSPPGAGTAPNSYGKKSSRAIGIGGAAGGASAFSSSRSGESLNAAMLSGTAGGSGNTGNLSSSMPSNISPAMRAIREPVRIASISPAMRPQTAAPAAAGYAQAQWNAHNASLNTPASAAVAPVRTSSRSPAGMLGSPPSSAALAPPTERTRLLLESGFSLRDEGEGEPDDERDGFAGPLIHQSYGSSRIGSSSASPSPEQSLDALAAVHTARQSKAFVAFILPVTVILCVGNSVTWKRTLNRFASVDGSQRNLEFFVNQWTLVLYTLIAGAILAYRWMFTSIITYVILTALAQTP